MPVWERSMRKLVSQVSANGDIAYAMCQGGVLRSTIEALGPGRLDETTEAKAIVARFGGLPRDWGCGSKRVLSGSLISERRQRSLDREAGKHRGRGRRTQHGGYADRPT